MKKQIEDNLMRIGYTKATDSIFTNDMFGYHIKVMILDKVVVVYYYSSKKLTYPVQVYNHEVYLNKLKSSE